jgi:hypothetical protein
MIVRQASFGVEWKTTQMCRTCMPAVFHAYLGEDAENSLRESKTPLSFRSPRSCQQASKPQSSEYMLWRALVAQNHYAYNLLSMPISSRMCVDYDLIPSLFDGGTASPTFPPAATSLAAIAAFFAACCICALACPTAASLCALIPPGGPAPFVAAIFNSFRSRSMRIASDEKPGMLMLYSRPRWNWMSCTSSLRAFLCRAMRQPNSMHESMNSSPISSRTCRGECQNDSNFSFVMLTSSAASVISTSG